ncbi:MAG TPA: peptidylprolyl isomerase [Burkholderiales bacterium]|nr:peptidylprolyl isomerase [Burkholderiales bacterium]
MTAAALAAPAIALAQTLPTKEPAAKPAAPATREGPVATVNGVAIPRTRVDFIVRQQAARGAQDSDQLRARVREVLVNNEVIVQEANKAGLTKKAEVQVQLEMARQEVIVNNFVNDWISKHPISDAEIQTEYERAKSQTGSTEYKARHILVETEDEAKKIIADLKKGGKFDELAKTSSKDTGSKDRGGDLDWQIPGVFDKTFADAMVGLQKGKMTDAPVRTRFGYHIIQLDDVRPVKIPPLAEVKPQIQQRLVQLKVDKMVADLRAKAKVE